MTNAEGLQITLDAMNLEPVNEALIAIATGLADAVDADPKNAALWREFRAAVTELRKAGAGDVDDDTTEFLVSIRTPVSAKVGDPAQS